MYILYLQNVCDCFGNLQKVEDLAGVFSTEKHLQKAIREVKLNRYISCDYRVVPTEMNKNFYKGINDE